MARRWLVALAVTLAVGPPPALAARWRAPRTSAIGDRTLRGALAHVAPGAPPQTATLGGRLGLRSSWTKTYPDGLCAAFASSVVKRHGGVGEQPILYVDAFARAARRSGYRRTSLRAAPAGSLVFVTAPGGRRHQLDRSVHVGILERPADGGMHVVESGFVPGTVGGPQVVQRAFFDGKRWEGRQVGHVILAPPDTRR